jgi:TRAP-type C4-dicarboxylate transport system permease small subunit
MQPAIRLVGRAIDLTMYVGAAAVVLMMLHISIDVVSKYIFQRPLPGTIAIVSNYYMIVVAFLPLAFTERRNGHISVEVATSLLPMRVQRILNLIAMLFGAVIFAALAWQSWIEAGRAMQVGAFEIEQNAKLLIWPPRYLLPLGCGLMAVTLVLKICVALARGSRQSLQEPFL